MKNLLINLVKFAISAGLIYYLFRQATSGDDFDRLLTSPKNWNWLLLAFGACLAAFVLGFVRWHLLVRVLDLPFRMVDAVRLGFIGLFFCVFTIGVVGGDTLRAVYVCRLSPNKKPEAIASVVFDRLVGLLTMLGIAALAFGRLNVDSLQAPAASLTALKYAGTMTIGLAVIGFAGLAVLLAVPELKKHAWTRRGFLQLMTIPKLGPFVGKMTDVVAVYRDRPLAIVGAFLLSVGVNLCFAVTIFAIAVALGAIRPSMSQHFLIEPITMVANALPLPGGIGGMEATLAFLYHTLADGSGVVVAFTFRFFMLIASAIGGAIWLFNRESVSEAELSDAAKSE